MNKKIKILLSAMMVSFSALFLAAPATLAGNESTIVSASEKDSKDADAKNKDKGKYHNGWVTVDCVNIRKQPSTKAKILGHAYFNEVLDFYNVSKDWARILYRGGAAGYVNRKYLSENQPAYRMHHVPYTNGKKTYMPYKIHKGGRYRSIFSTSSKQYRLQQYCHTGKFGVRQYKDRFCVALGSAFHTSIGQYFDLYLENGEVIKCVMADQKADAHTDPSNIFTVQSGCMSEFIVDMEKLNTKARKMGDISFCTDRWRSRVVKVKVYEKYIEL